MSFVTTLKELHFGYSELLWFLVPNLGGKRVCVETRLDVSLGIALDNPAVFLKSFYRKDYRRMSKQ